MTHPNSKNQDLSKQPKLQKFLADSGLCSRRKGEGWIEDGIVSVNGEIAKLGCRVNPDKDVVKVNGKRIQAHTQSPLTLGQQTQRFTCSTRMNMPRG